MAYIRRPFNPLVPAPNQVVNELDQANDNFDILAQAFVSNNPETLKVKEALNSDNSQNAVYSQNADTVDGFHASLTPAPNTIVPLNADGILDLSATYVKSSVYTFRRVDLTNATSDYMLQVGEEAIINFTNATSVPLRIATQSGTYYELDLILSNNIGATGGVTNPIYLNPNNTTYSDAFAFRSLFTNSAFTDSTMAVYSAFRIGWAFSSARTYITNFTTAKYLKGLIIAWGASVDIATIEVYACSWINTTTNWTSLGTITFPQQSSGYILVRRLA